MQQLVIWHFATVCVRRVLVRNALSVPISLDVGIGRELGILRFVAFQMAIAAAACGRSALARSGRIS